MKRPDRAAAKPAHAHWALLLIDVINDLSFPQGVNLLRQALPMAKRLKQLRARCEKLCVPVVYVNDNFGRWRSDFRAVIEHCLDADSLGREVTARLLPGERDYFVLKPLHSGFFSTTLDVLLSHLQIDTLILAGMAADICILFTANDAYMRGFNLYVPRDCVAANSETIRRSALKQMRDVLKANVSSSERLRIPKQPGLDESAADEAR